MSLINSTAIPSGATAYEIDQSLRFNDNDSAYLSKTFASAGNRKTWTWSAWVKRGNLNSSTSYQQLFTAGTGNPPRDVFFFDGVLEEGVEAVDGPAISFPNK